MLALLLISFLTLVAAQDCDSTKRGMTLSKKAVLLSCSG